jgi:hypothetical protein
MLFQRPRLAWRNTETESESTDFPGWIDQLVGGDAVGTAERFAIRLASSSLPPGYPWLQLGKLAATEAIGMFDLGHDGANPAAPLVVRADGPNERIIRLLSDARAGHTDTAAQNLMVTVTRSLKMDLQAAEQMEIETDLRSGRFTLPQDP